MTSLLKQLNNIEDDDLKYADKLANRENVLACLKEMQAIIFPDYFTYQKMTQEELLTDLKQRLLMEVGSEETVINIINKMPQVKKLALTDIQAIYDGDPAAVSKSEVVLCYPGFYAIFIYRIAHSFVEEGITIVPRMMSEYAHAKTGIDINPGATIGEYFCIDHGTGVVIGETANIGHHVKLYQGVTIGAKSFKLDDNGNPVKGGKRHPDIGNNVVIYANATILGGNTRIGNNCIIGGNCWITHSIEDNQFITLD